MDRKDANKKYYFVPLAGGELAKILDNMASHKAPVKGWLQGKSKDKVEEYRIGGFDMERLRLNLAAAGLFSKLLTSKNVGKLMFFRLGEERAVLFTTSVLRYDKGAKCHFIRIENEVFRGQQRFNYRLPPGPYNRIAFKIGEEELSVLDLSAGGIGIIVDKGEAERFAKRTVFQDCLVTLNNKRYEIPEVEVMSQWEERTASFEPTGRVEVGMRFKGLSNVQDEELSRTISAQAREAEIRKSLAKTGKPG